MGQTSNTNVGAIDRVMANLRDYVPPKAMVLDFTERVIFVILFGFFAIRMISSFDMRLDFAVSLLIISELLPIALIASRKWSRTLSISDRPLDWALGFIGSSIPLLSVQGAANTLIPQAACAVIILIGLAIQISAKVVLWRSFGVVPANHGVKAGGPYRFVRHPMYAGYTIVHAGFLLAFPSLWNAVVYSSALAAQIARLLREERLLNDDPKYRAFSSRVRFRLFPGVY